MLTVSLKNLSVMTVQYSDLWKHLCLIFQRNFYQKHETENSNYDSVSFRPLKKLFNCDLDRNTRTSYKVTPLLRSLRD